MIISSRASVCTGTLISPTIVLTGAHCVAPAAQYRVSTPSLPTGVAVERAVIHPGYDPKQYAAGRVTADLALVKIAQPLPHPFRAAAFAVGPDVRPGDPIVIAGYGSASSQSGKGMGTGRAARLHVTGRPGSLQIRVSDPLAHGTRGGAGACTGDSGGPGFQEHRESLEIIGVISWSTGPNNTAGCGGLTGLTPVGPSRGWILKTQADLDR